MDAPDESDSGGPAEAHHGCLLLTGGTGFMGRRLAPLLAKAYPAMRRVSLDRSGHGYLPGWERLNIDIVDAVAFEAAIAALRPTIVVHLAAQSSVGQVAAAAEATWRVNMVATLTLATALARHAPDMTLLFSSTAEVYGASFRNGPAHEETPPLPGNSYALSKLAAESILRDILPQTARLIVARAFNHSGPGQDERFVLPSWAAQIARAEAGLGPAEIKVGNLAAARDFSHVDDVAATYTGLLAAAPRLPRHTTVNVGSGKATSLKTLLDGLIARASRPLTVSVDPARMRPSDIPVAVGDMSRLESLLSSRPQSDVGRILDDVLAHARSAYAATSGKTP